jgi:hypothetical protein
VMARQVWDPGVASGTLADGAAPPIGRRRCFAPLAPPRPQNRRRHHKIRRRVVA